MRFLTVLATTAGILLSAVTMQAAPTRGAALSTPEVILAWMNTYHAKPDPLAVPAAVKALSQAGALRDPETAGVYVGFVAGVLGSNPDKAAELLEKMLPLPGEDQWMVVRAVAYSGLPNWKVLLQEFAEQIPSRRAMIGKYVSGALPTLFDLAPEKDPSAMEKLQRFYSREKGREGTKTWALDLSPELLDTFWGYYFATRGYGPIARIVAMLPWSKDKDHDEKLVLGAMAKFTLARNASRDDTLLVMLKRMARHQDEETAPILKQVIDSADIADTGRIRKEAMASLENLKRYGPGSRREIATWGKIGEGAIGLGCVAAALTGQVAMGLPCVLGGAATSAAVRYLSQ
jgi:hypothetical protein